MMKSNEDDLIFRLEFLGDALLDFLVVRQVFLDDQGELNPGRVTNIRQDSTNNNHLGYILVSSNLHQKIRYQSNDLSRQLRTYLDNQQRVSSRVFSLEGRSFVWEIFF